MIGSLNLSGSINSTTSTTHPVSEFDLDADFLGDDPFYKNKDDDIGKEAAAPEELICASSYEDNPEEVIYLKDDSPIEGAPYTRGPNGRYIKPSENKEIEWGTEYVAKLLGTTSQTIRSYADRYEDYLGIRKLGHGRRKFTKENIDRLRELIKFKDTYGLTLVQLDEYINSGKNPYKYLPEDQKLDKIIEFFDKFQHSMEENLKTMFTALADNNQRLIEERNESQTKTASSLLNALDEQNKKIEAISFALEQNTMSKEKELLDTISKLQRDLKEQENLVKTLYEDNKSKEELITELQSKQKKGLFSFFK